jgi:5'-3' exonuclease
MNLPKFDVALIDADSMFYMIAATQPSTALAKKSLDQYIEGIIEIVETPDVYVFIKGKNNFRYAVDIEYKQHRKNAIEEELQRRIDMLYEYGREQFIECDGAEADDWVGAYATQALREEKLPLMIHIDKDLNMLPGWHYNFKRKEFYFVEYAVGYTFLMAQLLQGDSTDNIKGSPKIGPVKANKLIENLPQHAMLEKVIDEYRKYYGAAWESAFVKVANCIYIRDDMEHMRPLNLNELLEVLKFQGESEDEYIPRDTKEFNPAIELYKQDMPGTAAHIEGEPWTQDTGSSLTTDQKELSDSFTLSSDLQEECTLEENNVSALPLKKKRGRPAKRKS